MIGAFAGSLSYCDELDGLSDTTEILTINIWSLNNASGTRSWQGFLRAMPCL